MDAILYTSNTGHTARYAAFLGEATGLPVYSLKDVGKAVPAKAEVLYLGWVMADHVKGYPKAARRYTVRAVCAVSMGSASDSTEPMIREKTGIPQRIPVFTLPGGFDMSKLGGLYRFMMRIFSKKMAEQISMKAQKTQQDQELLDALQNGIDSVKREALDPVLAFWKAQA